MPVLVPQSPSIHVRPIFRSSAQDGSEHIRDDALSRWSSHHRGIAARMLRSLTDIIAAEAHPSVWSLSAIGHELVCAMEGQLAEACRIELDRAAESKSTPPKRHARVLSGEQMVVVLAAMASGPLLDMVASLHSLLRSLIGQYQSLSIAELGLNVANVLAVFHALTRCNAHSLLPAVHQCIAQQWESLESSGALLSLSRSGLRALLASDHVTVTEIALYQLLVRWGERECAARGVAGVGDSLAECISHELQLIRFPLMTMEDLVSHVFPAALVSQQQMVELFAFRSLPRDRRTPRAISFGFDQRLGGFPRALVAFPPYQKDFAVDSDRVQLSQPCWTFEGWLRLNVQPMRDSFIIGRERALESPGFSLQATTSGGLQYATSLRHALVRSTPY
jgi:hypothetical protein